MTRVCWCYDCGPGRCDVSNIDEDGFCAACGSDNVFGYDTEDVKAMYAPPSDDEGTR